MKFGIFWAIGVTIAVTAHFEIKDLTRVHILPQEKSYSAWVIAAFAIFFWPVFVGMALGRLVAAAELFLAAEAKRQESRGGQSATEDPCGKLK